MINRVPSLDEMPAGAPPQDGRETASRLAPQPGQVHPGWFKRLGNVVGDHPVLALAAGAAVGITLGCLVKRR